MRRLLTLSVLFTCLIAGCGGGDDSSSSPLDAALSYLPPNAPFAVAIDTDVEGDQYKALRALLKKFPFGDQVLESLRQQLEQSSGGVNFDEDVRPLLGNPFVVGATDPRSFTEDSTDTPFVAAIQAKDKGALDDLIEKAKPKETGEQSGATLYEDDGTVFAIKDDVAIFAANRQQLTAALERADGDEHLGEDAFNEALDGLPESALARVYADLEALVKSDPGSGAGKVEWVGALRTLGLTLAADDDALDVDFRVRTEGDLSDEDLPIAAGEDAPPVIKREGELGLGIRDLGHIVRFAEAAAQAIDPGAFGDYAQAKKTIDSQLGVSLDDDLIGQLSGDVSASVSTDGGFGVRAQLEDPQAFEETLAKVADVLPSFAEGAGLGTVGLSKPSAGEDFYALAQPDGDAVVFGVVEGVLVVANDPARADELATQEPTAVSGAEGSVVFSADAEQLVSSVIEQLGPAVGLELGGFESALITQPLGDLTGSMSATPEGLRGRFSLAIE